MSLKALGGLLEAAPQYVLLRESLRPSRAVSRAQVLSDAVPFILANLWPSLDVPMLVVTPRPEDARLLHDQLLVWSGEDDSVLHFPETEALPFERLVTDADTVQRRLSTLARLATPGGRPPIVVASATAISQKTVDREAFVSVSHTLERDQSIDLDELLGQWRRMGYQLEAGVSGPGQVSRRGGILDIYPVDALYPARIELWGSEIESIRLFDPETQRSTETVDSITVTPARETLSGLTERDDIDRQLSAVDVSNCTAAAQERLIEEFSLLRDGYEVEDLDFYAGFFNRGCLLDYFPDGALLVQYRPSEIAEAAWDAEERANELREVKERRGDLPLHFRSSHLPWGEVEKRATGFARRLEVMPWGAEDLVHRDTHILPFAPASTFLGNLDRFAQEADELAQAGHRVLAVTSHSRRLGEILSERGVTADLPACLQEAPADGSVTVLQSEGAGLRDGFVLSSEGVKLVVLSDIEIFGIAKQRRSIRRTARRRELFLSEIEPGDYVVHVDHGIGRFVGTGRQAKDEGGTEYLTIQYAQGDKLHVPLEHLDRVAPYIAPIDRPPHLTRLGTQEWKRAKERAQNSTREMAAELLSLYAARELAEGYAMAADTPWQAELEESFPYEETPDQITTIGEVKDDLESTKPMDRLICGDVGYGKTEVALRAAFKTVMGGKQVAVLVPTTVLAQQHYVTFSQRMSAYPVKVEVLSRFRTDAEQRETLAGLASGNVDICIGTHRLIQKDVAFKDLGLVVVDEEQRFGVAHKERLKQMRSQVDILTMTATPIPRTLHMSLSGVRDMSTIETPPEERLPVKTYVSEFSDELIQQAILRELDRQGQVYFLHNRVRNIDYMADYVQRLVPEARVGIAHGQMHENELEQTMVDFADGKMDVLVCTTIIESGLDIPNVNTLIINRADTFGLAQLYQLRGRVGRSARRAYTYQLIPKTRSLTEAAEKRLKAMLAATELGAGFKIAMKDLEIRGAGNILGSEQSGHIHAVGFDLYTRLLSTAVEDLRAQRAAGGGAATAESNGQALLDGLPGQGTGDQDEVDKLDNKLVPDSGPSVDLGIPAGIPEDYVVDLPTRMGLYHRLVQIPDLGGVDDMEDELTDRFGPLPLQAQNLLYVLRLKLRAARAGIKSIARGERRVVLHLEDDVGGAMRALQRTLGPGVEVGHTQIRMDLNKLTDAWQEALGDTVQALSEFRERIVAQVAAGVA
jgi:transcription-repair coupling factor (superfamily II helicase)